MRGTLRSTLVSLALSAICGAAVAQVPLSDIEQQYARALDLVLTDWEKGNIRITKSDIQNNFVAQLKSFETRRVDENLDRLIPIDFIAGNWVRLSDVLTPSLRLSNGARLVLIGGVVDAAGELKNRGIAPNRDSMLNALRFPLFITLAAAQEESVLAKAKEINSVSVRRGGLWFFSLGWPFCCATSQ